MINTYLIPYIATKLFFAIKAAVSNNPFIISSLFLKTFPTNPSSKASFPEKNLPVYTNSLRVELFAVFHGKFYGVPA